jgi:hypothetical protein
VGAPKVLVQVHRAGNLGNQWVPDNPATIWPHFSQLRRTGRPANQGLAKTEVVDPDAKNSNRCGHTPRCHCLIRTHPCASTDRQKGTPAKSTRPRSFGNFTATQCDPQDRGQGAHVDAVPEYQRAGPGRVRRRANIALGEEGLVEICSAYFRRAGSDPKRLVSHRRSLSRSTLWRHIRQTKRPLQRSHRMQNGCKPGVIADRSFGRS